MLATRVAMKSIAPGVTKLNKNIFLLTFCKSYKIRMLFEGSLNEFLQSLYIFHPLSHW